VRLILGGKTFPGRGGGGGGVPPPPPTPPPHQPSKPNPPSPGVSWIRVGRIFGSLKGVSYLPDTDLTVIRDGRPKGPRPRTLG